MALYYLSFADADRPKGQQWLGAAIVEADDTGAAVRRAWEVGCNPGGEVMSICMDATSAAAVSEGYKDRLLGKADLVAMGERVEPGGGQLLQGSADTLGAHAEAKARERGER